MKLKNHTDIPTDLIKDIIRFVRPPGISKFDVRISNLTHGTKGRGRAYYRGSGYHSTADPFVIVSIATAERFKPYVSWEHKGYLPIVHGSREEALVTLLAHELRHLWQEKVKRGHRVWGARGQFSERDADAYALHKLREWRRR
jgi:hypothetical protein